MSRITDFLKMFIWDIETDREKEFDYNKSIAGNLDKIDNNAREQYNATKTLITTQESEQLEIQNASPVKSFLSAKGKTVQIGTPSPSNPVRIRNVGDNINLFDVNGTNFNGKGKTFFTEKMSISNSTVGGNIFTDYASNLRCRAYHKCLKNEKIVISLDSNFVLSYALESGADGIITKQNAVNNNVFKYTATEDKLLCLIISNKTSTALANDEITQIKNSLKIEIGETATNYSKFGVGTLDLKIENETESKIVSFPFEKNQMLREDDYFDKTGIHIKRKTIILNGTENWNKRSGNNNTFTYNFGSIINKGLCDRYTVLSSNEIDKKDGIYLSSTTSIIITDMRFTNVSDFKAELVKNNATVEIAIKDYDKIEEYTYEQKVVLSELNLLEGYNKITCLNEVKPVIHFEYYYNNQLNKSFCSRLDEIERQSIDLANMKTDIENIKKLLSTTNTSALLLNNLENELQNEVNKL